MRFRINIMPQYGSGYLIACRTCLAHLVTKNALPDARPSEAYAEAPEEGPLTLAHVRDIEPRPGSVAKCDGCGTGSAETVEHDWDSGTCRRCRSECGLFFSGIMFRAPGTAWSTEEPACARVQ